MQALILIGAGVVITVQINVRVEFIVKIVVCMFPIVHCINCTLVMNVLETTLNG